MKRAEYHVHTGASYDSDVTPEAVLERALAAGLDVLCVTDHDTLDGALALRDLAKDRLEIVVGCEVTAEDGSHLVGLGLRAPIGRGPVLDVLEEIHAQGGSVLLPHPFRRGSGVFRNELRRTPEFVLDVLARADAVECFNARDSYENNRRSRRLALDHGFPAVAASDAHHPRELGRVYVEYDDDRFVHGVSPRRLFFPAQPPAAEHPAKRALMELYHRNERRLPSAVRDAYRTLRASVKRKAPTPPDAAPALQVELPAAPGGRRP